MFHFRERTPGRDLTVALFSTCFVSDPYDPQIVDVGH